MTTHTLAFATFAFLIATSATTFAQHPAMPAGMTHEQHQAQMKKDAELKQRGALAMGFDQDKTVHHFLLRPDGGVIAVGLKEASDEASLAQVRAHLKSIAGEFASGDFARPFATHAEMPPGVKVMQQRKKTISYRYEDTALGGQVVISTPDRRAKDAVHEFLRYQIREHKTGDPVI